MAVFAELARRGISHPQTISFVKRFYPDSPHGSRSEANIPAAILIWVTFLVGFVGMALVSYMLQQVITTLCMIETPVAAITISPSTHELADKEEKEGLLEEGPAITLVHQKPITSSIRATIKHLVAHAGRWSRFRGIKLHLLYAFFFTFSSGFHQAILPRFPGQSLLIAAISGALLANIHAMWTHKVVSMPSDLTFFERIPSMAAWKKLTVPAAVNAVMPYVAMYITCGAGMLMGLHKLDQDAVKEYNGAQWTSLIVRGIAVFVIGLVCTLFLCIPAIVTLVRTEASLLSEDQDTIVPFDRTFGGKVTPKHFGGYGVVGFFDAWRSFNWEARRRLIKLYVKIFFAMMAMALVFVHVLLIEVLATGSQKYLGNGHIRFL